MHQPSAQNFAPTVSLDKKDSQAEPSAPNRFGLTAEQIHAEYLKPDEQLLGMGRGGSESLVMFVGAAGGRVVRKVCSEGLASVAWDPNGTGVMTPPSTKGGLQADYLRALPPGAAPYFPTVYDVAVRDEMGTDGQKYRKLVFDQSLVDGLEMSTFISDQQPRPEVVTALHEQVMKLLGDKIHPERRTLNTGDSIEVSHLDKIEARLELSRDAAPNTFGQLLDSPEIIIDGTRYRNIKELLAFFRQPQVVAMLEPKYMGLVMGDTNTENVMITEPEALAEAMRQPGKPDFTYDDIGLKFIDPRAIGHNSAGAGTVDDYMYDNKPPHNTLGNYDRIHGEFFDLSVFKDASGTPNVNVRFQSDNPFSEPYRGIQDSEYLQDVMRAWGAGTKEFQENDPNWLLRFTFMMGSHFAAMPPFHFTRDEHGNVPESAAAQKRAMAIYCEGIRWLNHAQDLINGDSSSVYGIRLPEIKADNRS